MFVVALAGLPVAPAQRLHLAVRGWHLSEIIDERRYVAGASASLAEEWREITSRSHLLRNLVHRDLTVRYKRSVLGFFWTMLHPLLLMVILTMVFANVFRFATPHYEVYVLSALLPWNFFSQTTVSSMTSR